MNSYHPQRPPSSSGSTVARNYLARSLVQRQAAELQRCRSHTRRSIANHHIVYTGFTALALCRIELPWCPSIRDDSVHILYDDRNRRPTRANTQYFPWHCTDIRQGQFSDIQYVQDNTSIVCTHPLVTWAILSRHIGQTETIVLLDAIVRGTSCTVPVTANDVDAFLDQTPNFSGKRRCLAALPFIRNITDSPMESRSVLALLRHGLKMPQLQWRIYIPELHWEAVVDMAYPDAHVIIEYDGDAHRIDKRQYRWDERKRQALRAMGFTVIVVFADDVLTAEGRAAFANRVANALGVAAPGRPLPEHRALLDDERRMMHRNRQRRYRARQRAQGRKV
ncbi:DUF559 domain-containing protein [Bifidobacterium tissieri]|uniref:DUF559 domain-containing protein n=1 Tax=Bifidobacterium tissieri TaxID=1630162 RepID=A0A5M9ZJR3_9BIFI|nr:DUF559 domain-containing protein [Bifidobacterium tissieri]